MKTFVTLLFSILLSQAHTFARSDVDVIIPKPQKILPGRGEFILTDKTRYFSETPLSDNAMDYLQQHLKVNAGYTIAKAPAPPDAGILFKYGSKIAHGGEAYLLHITEKQITVEATDESGFFYAVVSLMQMLPPAIWGEDETEAPRRSWPLPACTIEDYPRFSWRGMMLDSSRNFFSKSYVKKFIDRLAQHKLNRFHWHLSDDEGWQLEIKKYPLLTQIDIEASQRRKLRGHYTQEDVREIVAYAKKRSVEVLPEIDMPAHALTAVTAYPSLLQDPNDKSRYSSIQGYRNNTIDVGLESSYLFLEEVISELAPLFPFDYIHLGGDEVPKGAWKGSPAVAALMRKERLGNSREVAAYFFSRMDKILAGYGRSMIAWQEVISYNAKLRDETVIMAWRGDGAGVKAAKNRHRVIMAPAQYLYFDQQYIKRRGEPGHTWAGAIDTEKAYSYNPVPREITAEEARFILGVHGCLWSETLFTEELADYMAWPRIFALAETGWSRQERRQWDDFRKRMLGSGLQRLEAQKIKYRQPDSD